jgi:DNA helicase-2/ATP-dependent DNA helicase PcrA
MLKEAAQTQGVPAALLDRRVALWKQAGLDPAEVPPGEPPGLVAAFGAYEAALAAAGLWDYEDLISRPVRLLNGNAGLREVYRRRFRHLLVDEYQDLNEAQYRFFRALAGPETDVMVIGDPDQAIYGFRGARPEYFHRFAADWPQARRLAFTETYRLPAPVLTASRMVLSQAGVSPPSLVTHALGEDPVTLLEGASPQAEARAVARHIERLVGGLTHRSLNDEVLRERALNQTASFRDIAVLYRFHALSAALQEAFSEAGIPWEEAREDLGPDWEGLDLQAEKVKLLSLHAAKGLEFPYVFIVGCEAGLIPWEPEGGREVDMAEECRLFYVGLTRARRQVCLTRARTRTLWGKSRTTSLSPLAAALNPQKFMEEEGRGRPRPAGRQGSLF